MADTHARRTQTLKQKPASRDQQRTIFEPGWVWEVDEKPLLGNPRSCPMRHIGYCVAGRLAVRMVDTNVTTKIGPGNFFEIPAGHDVVVDGNERVELVFAPPEHAR